ncbi:MAG: GGDEF domain-containing protein, partial [Erythrobacter cryptus]
MAFPRDLVRLILGAVLLALAWAAPAVAHSAQEMAHTPTCHATSGPTRDLAAMAPRAAWICGGAP